MPDTNSLSEEDEIYFQQFIAYKIRRMQELDKNEYEMHRDRYDGIFAMEFEQLHKKLKKYKK